MECDFNLLCYGLFKIPKIIIILKEFRSIKKLLFKKKFVIFFICLITSWFEIGNGNKMLLSISSKYSYFKPIFNYIGKGLWKGILICRNCDTLMCFCLVVCGENITIDQALIAQ
jgi:hypothetical protein